jgi:DNA modification methylase
MILRYNEGEEMNGLSVDFPIGNLWCGDCLEVLPRLVAAGSVDFVLADVPYGQTQNDWDTPIPFGPMWAQLRRVTKPNAAIVLMAAQPFASKLICSNLDDFRYDLIWQKNKPTGFLNAKRQPLRNHEHILIFYRSAPIYNPQKTKGHEPGHYAKRASKSENYGAYDSTEYGGSTDRYPLSILPIPIINNDSADKVHPTQKPVDLMAWLIRSYTKPGATVLDFAAGVGTTAIAAMREGRQFMCIEKEQRFWEVTCERVRKEHTNNHARTSQNELFAS